MEPSVHLCVTRELILPVDLWAVRWLSEDDHEAFVKPFLKGQDHGWTLEEFRELRDQGYTYCGIFLGGRICSSAGLWKRAPDVWEVIAVVTKEEHRHRGMATSVVHFVADYILQHVRAASYTSRESNLTSIRTAQSVGFKYCPNIVDNDKWCAKYPRPNLGNVNCPLIDCDQLVYS
jgi:predicted GNAT family acetyltransferase